MVAAAMHPAVQSDDFIEILGIDGSAVICAHNMYSGWK